MSQNSNCTVNDSWYKANSDYLMEEVEQVRLALLAIVPKAQESSSEEPTYQPGNEAYSSDIYPPFHLDILCANLGLKPIQRLILLLCVGMELIPDFRVLCAKVQDDSNLAYPTFSLAFSVNSFDDWSVLSDGSPLIRFSLIEIDKQSKSLTLSPLKISKSILCYLLGENSLDEKLLGIVQPIKAENPVKYSLQPSHQYIVDQIAGVWSCTADDKNVPVVQLCSSEKEVLLDISSFYCSQNGCNLHVIKAHLLPSNLNDLNYIGSVLLRSMLLTNSVFMLDCHQLDTASKQSIDNISLLIENLNGRLIIATHDQILLSDRSFINIDVPKITASEQLSTWVDVLGASAVPLKEQIYSLISQFNLSQQAIYKAVETATTTIYATPADELGNFGEVLWDSCRKIARPQLDNLAKRIETNATWDQLVLKEEQKQIVRNIIAQVRQRYKVYREWGFANKTARGLGISALFSGLSGLGKTFTAEVIANELRSDLCHVDLSAIVSKYIGETEKNLRRIFDAAESSGAVLLFDEADALFGRRTQVRDSHDRNANMETNYLLQRIEAYSGLAILTTNAPDAIDNAFKRRIRFIVKFEFPLAQERIEIWKRVFPTQTPTEGLDYNKLARLNATGATITNIAMHAAFLAAEASEPIMMKHLHTAAIAVCLKEGSSPGNEIKGWV